MDKNPQREEAPIQYTRLMTAVGSALLSWSQVENGMGLLFGIISGIPDPRSAGAMFDTMKAFDVRLAVLDKAMELEPIFSDDEKEVWVCLSRRLRNLYKKRHSIAHFSVGSSDEIIKSERISPFFSWNKHSNNKLSYLSTAEIYARGARFNEAANAVTWFGAIGQHRKMPQTLPRPPREEPVLILRIRESLSRKSEDQTRTSVGQ